MPGVRVARSWEWCRGNEHRAPQSVDSARSVMTERAAAFGIPATARKLCGGGSFVIGGTTFDVRAAEIGPNSTPFNGCLVSYDSAQQIAYLTLVCDARGSCTGAQVMSHTPTSFGVYEATMMGPVNELGPWVVLGQFLYPLKTKNSDVVDGTREIDVEWAQWGNATAPNLNFSVWPDQPGLAGFTCAGALESSSVSAGGAAAFTSRILWQPGGVYFETFAGRSDAPIGRASSSSRRDWRHAPSNALRVPQTPELYYFNLWRFGNSGAGLENHTVTVAITDFRFTPMLAPLPAATQPLGCG